MKPVRAGEVPMRVFLPEEDRRPTVFAAASPYRQNRQSDRLNRPPSTAEGRCWNRASHAYRAIFARIREAAGARRCTDWSSTLPGVRGGRRRRR